MVKARTPKVNNARSRPRRRPRRSKPNAQSAARLSTGVSQLPTRGALSPVGVKPLGSLMSHQDSCLVNFTKTRINPFARIDGPICNPVHDGGFYTTFPFYSRFEVVAGTNGQAFAVLNPYHGAYGANNIWHTTASYATDGINIAAAGVQPLGLQTAYNASTTFKLKLVSCGMKLTSTVAPLNAKGTVYSIKHAENTEQTAESSNTITTSILNAAAAVRVGKNYYSIYQPQGGQHDDTWSSYGPPTSYTMGLAVLGAGAGDTFLVEVIGYMMVQMTGNNQNVYQSTDPRATRAAGIISESYSALRDNTSEGFYKYLADAGKNAKDYLIQAGVQMGQEAIRHAFRFELPRPHTSL